VRIAQRFAIGKYEVTFAEWDACVAAGGCSHRPADEGWGRGTRPVINVSWDDAKEYVRWLGSRTGHEYRLPSEAEWEYAARAGTETPRYWGNAANGACGYANVHDETSKRENEFDWEHYRCDDGYAETAPVGSFGASRFGLYDVLGNVLEWVEDCWHDNYGGALVDGSAWTSGGCGGRVLRGGSWGNGPRLMRSAVRGRDGTGYRDFNVGFRVARTLF
jgi:formylglycine-generating enzyme required for sulfatase activity